MIDKLKNENKTTKIFLALSIFTLLMILSLCYNGFYFADDYCLINSKGNGILKSCIDGYFNWDGRSLSVGAFLQYFLLFNLPVQLILLIWSFCFMFSGFLVYHIIKIEIDFSQISITKKYLILIILSIILWLGSFFHISETIYWATGGVYSFYLLLGAIWVFLFEYLQKNKSAFFIKTLFLFFSIITGASTHNLSIALITLVLITILIDYFTQQKVNTNYNILIGLMLISGLLFIVLAPGNFNRMTIANQTAKPDFSFIYYFKNTFRTLFLYLVSASFLSLFSIFASVFFAYLINPARQINFKFQLPKYKTKEDKILLLINSKWFLVALSTITPFLFIPEFVSKRTTIYFLFFMMIFVVASSLKIIIHYSKPTTAIKTISKNTRFIITFFSVLIITSYSFTIYNFYNGNILKNEITARESILKANKNMSIKLKAINPKLNCACFQNRDYKPDAEKFILENLEKYYSVKLKIEE